jgi:hypothetical protein
MRRSSSFAGLLCTFLLGALPAMAQDFGKGWIERVSHEIIEDEAQLSPHAVEWKFAVGELYSYDSNIFLTDTDRTHDSIFTTFGNVNLKYAEERFDAEADLLVNYNAYVSTSDISADEERFFGRVRYQGASVTLALSEIFRRESSPTDAVFATRVSRFFSSTQPLIVVKASEVFAIELQSDIQVINYLRQAFDNGDNFNTRTLLTLAYTTGWNGVDLLVQGGYFGITYSESTAPPDAAGYIGRLGIRGDLSPNLHAVILGGVTKADSDDFPGTGEDVSMTTADIEIHMAYTPTDTTSFYADYTRRFGFSAEGAPFQVVDFAGLSGVLTVREDLRLRSRLGYSRVHVPGGLRRAYYDFSVGTDYKIHPHVLLDASLTYRWGVVPGSGGLGNFGDAILSLGAAILF